MRVVRQAIIQSVAPAHDAPRPSVSAEGAIAPTRKRTATAPESREAAAHKQALGLPADASFSAVVDAELSRAQAVDPRVTKADMQRAVARAAQAEVLVPQPQRTLMGFTRLVDAKLTLDARAIGALADAALRRPAEATELLAAIDKGPGDGTTAFTRPKTRAELVASLVRHVVLGKGASLQLQLSAELATWLEETLTTKQIALRTAMGGAGGFCANLAASLPNVEPTFYSPDPLPARVAERFAAGVRTLDASGRRTALAGDASIAARVNYAAEYSAGEAFAVLTRTKLKIDDQERALVTSGSGRVILGSPANDRIGFGGFSDEALERAAKEHGLAFIVGAHYFTKGTPEDCAAQARQLAAQLTAMKRANPALLRHHQYVVPKVAANEPALFAALRGAFDSMSLNSVEAAALLKRPPLSREQAEAPETMLDGALAVKAALELKRVHFHGMFGDLVVIDRSLAVEPRRQVLALLRARQLASMKAANASGEIASAHDLFSVMPSVDGPSLAAVQAFADAIAKRFGLDAASRDKVARDFCCRGDDVDYYFVPNRGIHDRTGGTISLGDTIDASALVFSAPASTSRRLPQMIAKTP